ncbi:MAG TPA: DNA-binding protein, partial [Rubricoccaceae bacterium]
MRFSTSLRAVLAAAALILVLPAAQAQTTTIAAARTAGVGATVTVQGVVSRAKGFLTQFQDATGGLSIRQTSGGFFDAVTAGTIAPGTTIQVTGVLSQFRGLLQINQGTTNDLTAFTIVGQGAAPAAQTVTLAQLAASGEDFESELVVVRNVSTTSTGTFAAATNVPITDPTSSTNAVVLRIANAGDTDVDGTPIPAGPFSV